MESLLNHRRVEADDEVGDSSEKHLRHTNIHRAKGLDATGVNGSNKAASYIRALELLGPILGSKSQEFNHCADIWTIHSTEEISCLHEYILGQQKLGSGGGIFSNEELPSYWKHRFYSAALKSYKEFLVLNRHSSLVSKLFDDPEIDPQELSGKLGTGELDADEALASELGLDLGTKEGRETLGKAKIRIHQKAFRKNILKIYKKRCCITGLNVLPILRASHIVAWAEDKTNRLNPCNGLCLATTYDAAFDKHLISLDKNYRLILSPFLGQYFGSEETLRAFKEMEGKEIELPVHFHPNQGFLQKHRGRLAE